jgi:hypothetical protein
MSSDTIGLVVFTSFIGFLFWIIKKYIENTQDKNTEQTKAIQELELRIVEKITETNNIILSDKINFNILVEKVGVLEKQIEINNQEIKEIKSLIFSEPELKLMIKENI